MLLRDLTFYRMLLHCLPLEELVTLYDRTKAEHATLAEAIADELDRRLAVTG